MPENHRLNKAMTLKSDVEWQQGQQTVQQGNQRRTLAFNMTIKVMIRHLQNSQTQSKEETSCLCKTNSIMKVLVVLALFSVCNANILWQEPPKSDLELVKNAFWDYVAKATQTAEDSLKQIRESQMGQEVNAKISESTNAVNEYVASLQARVAPLTEQFTTQFNQEVEQLRARLEKDLSASTANVEEIVANIQRQMEELKKEATPYAQAMNPEALKAALLTKTNELKEQLDKSTTDLQAQMTPYTEEMRQKMEQSVEEFQRSMIPLAQSFETGLAQKTQEIQENLAQTGEELKAKLDATAQDLQAQLAVLWESFIAKTQ